MTRAHGGPISSGSEKKRRPLRPPSDRLAKLRGHDLFDVSMERIEESAQAAHDRGILPFHDDAYREAVAEAEGSRRRSMSWTKRPGGVCRPCSKNRPPARRNGWSSSSSFGTWTGLARRNCQLEIDAERRQVPRTELSGWQNLQEEILRFVEDARAALNDGKLQAHWESRPDIRASIEKGLPEAKAELAHGRSVPIDDFLIKCGRDIVPGDRLRWTEVVEAKPGMSWGSEPTGREEVVQFEGGLVERTAARSELEDRCIVEVYSRSDDGLLGKRSLSFGMLVGGGCWRAYWHDEGKREEKAREQGRELKESREFSWRPERYWSMRL